MSGVADSPAVSSRAVTARSAIGTGASGRVYVADDARLRRRVAVKVLHAALAEDAAFLRRFRAEAQVAASLHHPNVMAVYDWGDDDVPFMVLELLEGGSLRSMLDRERASRPRRPPTSGRQVTAALEYAHARGVVHRDIKPANLLFDEHGIVRVADFGLAARSPRRAGPNLPARWSAPPATPRPSRRRVHRSTGAPTSTRSPSCSSRRSPARSRSRGRHAIGTLAARANAPLVAPLELGRLGPVVERAGRPIRRSAIQTPPRCATRSPTPSGAAAARSRCRSSGLFGDVRHRQPTAAAATPASRCSTRTPPRTARVRELVVRGARRSCAAVRSRWSASRWPSSSCSRSRSSGTCSRRRQRSGSVAVPSLVGRKLDRDGGAQVRLADQGLGATVTARRGDDPAGFVIAQSPAPGRSSTRTSTVHLVVSRGPPPVAIPDMSSVSSVDAAAAALQSAGFAVNLVHPTTTRAGRRRHRHRAVVPREGAA